jgi:Putative polyhydroxyalkanoic acid system protein (PHA_gran_rgn)
MPQYNRKYPGKSADEIYARVDETMAKMAEKHSLAYEKDEAERTGKVSKMGIAGVYQVVDGEVTIDLKFPMLVPGPMKRTVEEAILKRLDHLFA